MQGSYRTALPLLEQAAARDGRDAETWFYLFLCYRGLDARVAKITPAYRAASRVLSLAPEARYAAEPREYVHRTDAAARPLPPGTPPTMGRARSRTRWHGRTSYTPAVPYRYPTTVYTPALPRTYPTTVYTPAVPNPYPTVYTPSAPTPHVPTPYVPAPRVR